LQWSKKAGTPAKLRPAEVDLSELLAGWNGGGDGDERSWAAAGTAEDPIMTIITIKRFAEIMLAKLCVRTCCTMRSHERVERAVTGRIFQALPNFCLDRQTDRRTDTMFAAAIRHRRPPLPSRDLDFKTWSCPSVEVLKPRSAPGRMDRRTDGQTPS
jgi:hypothetical protein